MARIGRRHKRKMQGTSNYVKKTTSTTPATHPPSNKRLRLQHKRRGGSDATIAKFAPTEPSELQSQHVSLRHALYYFYVYVLDAPHKNHWGGKDGTISILRKKLKLPPHTRRKIHRTLSNILDCLADGSPFDGSLGKTSGRPVLITSGSTEEELVANWMEQHLGFRMTTMLVNEHRREEGKERVGVSAVMTAFYRLSPKITIIEKVQSGGLNDKWMHASYNIAKQMQVMLGRITDEEIMTDDKGKECNDSSVYYSGGESDARHEYHCTT